MCFCVDLNRDCVKLKILVNWELPLWRLSLVHRLENHRPEKQRPLMRATFFYENIFLIELRSLRKYFYKKSKTPVGFCFSERFKRRGGKLTQSQLFANQHKLPIGLSLSCILVTVFVTVTEFLFRFSNKISG